MSKNKNDLVEEKLSDLPNEKYVKFFATFNEINVLEVSQWKAVHLIGYFSKKYYETYNTQYQFKFNTPSPSKCFEVFQIKRLAMVLSSNPQILKDYIDWLFLNKVVKAKRRLTSIAFMTAEGVVNEYKVNILLNNKNSSKIDRSTPLPEKYKNVFIEAGSNLNTYGELAFILQMSPLPNELEIALDKIQQIGFDKEILSKIV